MKSQYIIQKLSEPLKITDIDFRIQSITEKGFATILAYKDARVDMNRLDEVLGALWQDTYELIDGQLFCSIGIRVDGEWVWRQDVGTESMTEKEKGRASDAFKRAGFRWGIGRELYDYPRINLMLKPNEFTASNGRARQTYHLRLNQWTWNISSSEDGKIIKLTAHDQNGDLRFDSTREFNGAPQSSTTRQSAPAPTPKPKAPRAKIELVKDSEDWKNVMGAISEGKVLDISRFERRFNISKELKNELLQEIEVAKMANEHAETKSAYNSKHLTDALAEVNACSEIQKLNDLWSKHTELHTNKVFIGAVTARKKQLVKPKK